MPSLFRFDQDHLGIKTLFVKISLSRNFEAVSSRGLKWNIKEKQKETAFNKSYCYQHFIDKYEDSFPLAGNKLFCNILWYFCQKSEELEKNIVVSIWTISPPISPIKSQGQIKEDESTFQEKKFLEHPSSDRS